jgi:RimJ/RimL family protein N-acetyltransferase
MTQLGRIHLCPLTLEDLPILFNWINDREQVLFNAPYKPVHWQHHQKWFETVQQRKDMIIFGIRAQQTDKLIGTCQLHSIHPVHRTAELQIRIGEVAERGHGYGTEAIRKLLNFSFKDLNLHRVYLHVFVSNEAAIRAYSKAGFSREGVLRQHTYIDGEYLDVIVMGILQEEFYAR